MKRITQSLAFALMLVTIVRCANSPQTDFVFDEFKRQVERKGLKIDSVDKTELIYIDLHGTKLSVSLDNVRRDFARDSDTSAIANFVASLDSFVVDLPHTWNEAKDHVYISLFPVDFDFSEYVHSKVTDEVEKIYVFSASQGLTWISKNKLKEWGVEEADLVKQANSNGDNLLAKSKIAFDTIEGRKLWKFETDDEALKAALLFAPSMKEKGKRQFGFPFYAVMPVRDFCCFFSQRDFDFFSKRLGATVVDEYKKSGYPLTTEILKFTETGVQVVGKYPVEDQQ